MPSGRATAAALRPSRVGSPSVASRPASSASKARKTRGAAPEGGGDALNALGAQGSAGWEAPSGEEEPVEDALRDDRPGRCGAEPAESEHRLGAGKGLKPGLLVRFQGPALQPADEAAGEIGNDHHVGEPLRSPLREQPGVPDALLGEAEGLQGLPQNAARRIAEAEAVCGDGADAPRGQVLPRFCRTPETTGVEARRRREQCGVAGRQRGAAFGLDEWQTGAQARGCRPAARWPRAATGPPTAGGSPARRRPRRSRSSRTARCLRTP